MSITWTSFNFNCLQIQFSLCACLKKCPEHKQKRGATKPMNLAPGRDLHLPTYPYTMTMDKMGLKTRFLIDNPRYSISKAYISRELLEADMWKTIRSHSRGSKLRLSHPLPLEGLSHSESKCGLWNSNRFWFMSQFGPFLAL